MSRNELSRRSSGVRLLATSGCLAAVVAMAGCGGGGKDKAAKSHPLTAQEARAVRLGVPKEQVRRQLGPPAYVGGLNTRRGKSCWYYRIAQPAGQVDRQTRVDYRYCFKRDRVALYSSIEYQHSPFQRPPKVKKVLKNHPAGRGSG